MGHSPDIRRTTARLRGGPRVGLVQRWRNYELLSRGRTRQMTTNAETYSTGNSEEPLFQYFAQSTSGTRRACTGAVPAMYRADRRTRPPWPVLRSGTAEGGPSATLLIS